VLNRPLYQGKDKHSAERAGVGASLIAGIGVRAIDGYGGAQRFAPTFDALTAPNPPHAEIYESHYRRFVDLYPRLKSWFFLEEEERSGGRQT
jgi:hypothetical protein